MEHHFLCPAKRGDAFTCRCADLAEVGPEHPSIEQIEAAMESGAELRMSPNGEIGPRIPPLETVLLENEIADLRAKLAEAKRLSDTYYRGMFAALKVATEQQEQAQSAEAERDEAQQRIEVLENTCDTLYEDPNKLDLYRAVVEAGLNWIRARRPDDEIRLQSELVERLSALDAAEKGE